MRRNIQNSEATTPMEVSPELLIDHTAIHTLLRPLESGDTLPARTRELLQTIEILLFADTAWLCDSVTDATMDLTMRAYISMVKHGLANSRGDGVVRIARFTPSQIRSACSQAASSLFDYVAELNIDELRAAAALTYSVRPVGAQPLQYLDLAALKFDSPDAAQYIDAAVTGKGWLPSSCLHLLQGDLYAWFRKLSSGLSTNDDPALLAFNTLSRWKFNEALARWLSSDGTTPVMYTPAHGRSLSIDHVHEATWHARLHKLSSTGRSQILRRSLNLPALFDFAPSKSMGVPVFGVWVLRSIKTPCTIDGLFEALARSREDRTFQRFKSWLRSASPEDIDQTADLAVAEFAHTHAATSPQHRQVATYKLIYELPVSPLTPWIKIRREQEYKGSTWRQKFTALRRLAQRRSVTQLVGLYERAFVGDDDELLLNRVHSLLAPHA